jgi:hypothetical protein
MQARNLPVTVAIFVIFNFSPAMLALERPLRRML